MIKVFYNKALFFKFKNYVKYSTVVLLVFRTLLVSTDCFNSLCRGSSHGLLSKPQKREVFELQMYNNMEPTNSLHERDNAITGEQPTARQTLGSHLDSVPGNLKI